MLIEFDITTPPGRLMLGVVYDRLYKFFKEYDHNAVHDAIVQNILIKLIEKDQTAKLLLKIKDGLVIGHILMCIEYDIGVPIVTIHQAEFDDKVATDDEQEDWMNAVKSFAMQHHASRVALITRRNPRVFEKKYGFHVHRTIMTMDLPMIEDAITVNNGQALYKA